MDHLIPAVFDSGVFRPLEPVELAEGTQVHVQVPTAAQSRVSSADEADEETKKAWADYLDRMNTIPDRSPQDGLTNRDHDRIIYGV